MFIQVPGAVAEFERALIRERCIAGQSEAIRQGRKLGRRPRLSLTDRFEIVHLCNSGIPFRAVADAYGISLSYVFNIRSEAQGRKK